MTTYKLPHSGAEVEVVNSTEHFIMHKPVIGKGWNVTHRPSGLAACQNIRRKPDAVKFMKWIEQRASELSVDMRITQHENLKREPGWAELAAEVVARRPQISPSYQENTPAHDGDR